MRIGPALLFAMVVGCDSNPTPHPAVDAGYDAASETQTPAEGGPDEDHNGVPDCAEAGGYWDGMKCQGDVAAVGDSADVAAPDSSGADAADGNETLAGDAADTDDAGDAGDAEAMDPGPDAAD